MTEINADQIEFWNGQQGDKWVRLRERIDGMLGPLGEEAMRRLGAERGEAALDIGCGTGTTSLALAERVGPQGHVLGIDISRPMLNQAKARAGTIPEYNIEFQLADAQTHPLPESTFDAAFSRFGVMFFEEPGAAFGNIGHAMKPGGRLCFVTWRNRFDNPWITVPVEIAKGRLELPPRPGPEEPGQFSFQEEERVSRILTEGGWTDIEIDRYDTDLHVADTVEAAADFLLNMGPVALPFAEAPSDIQGTIRAELEGALNDFSKGDSVRMQYSTWIVRARRPG